MPMRIKNRWLVGAVAGAVSLSCGAVLAASLDQSLQLTKQITRAAAESQKTVDGLAEQKLDAVAEYRQIIARVDSLKAYNKQLRDLVNSQNVEKGAIQQQINGVDDTEKGLAPLMQQMIDTLEQFVQLDVPFLPEERAARVARLRTNMQRADVSLSEKYRQILEAYQIETDYGTVFSTYQGKVSDGGAEKTVNFLQVGRVAFVYQTLDGKTAFVWDNGAREWKALDGEYLSSVQAAINIANNTAPKDLVKLPIFAASEAAQ